MDSNKENQKENENNVPPEKTAEVNPEDVKQEIPEKKEGKKKCCKGERRRGPNDDEGPCECPWNMPPGMSRMYPWNFPMQYPFMPPMEGRRRRKRRDEEEPEVEPEEGVEYEDFEDDDYPDEEYYPQEECGRGPRKCSRSKSPKGPCPEKKDLCDKDMKKCPWGMPPCGKRGWPMFKPECWDMKNRDQCPMKPPHCMKMGPPMWGMMPPRCRKMGPPPMWGMKPECGKRMGPPPMWGMMPRHCMKMGPPPMWGMKHCRKMCPPMCPPMWGMRKCMKMGPPMWGMKPPCNPMCKPEFDCPRRPMTPPPFMCHFKKDFGFPEWKKMGPPCEMFRENDCCNDFRRPPPFGEDCGFRGFMKPFCGMRRRFMDRPFW